MKKSDLVRIVSSKTFYLTVFLVVLIDAMTVMTEHIGAMSLNDWMGMGMTEGFGIILQIGFAVPYSYAFCADIRNHFFRYQMIRASVQEYVKSKIVTCALGSGIAIVCGRMISLWILAFRYPLEGNGIVLLVAFLTQLFCEATFYAGLAFVISTILPDIFLVAATPLIFYYVISNVFSLFPGIYYWISFLRTYHFPVGRFQTIWGNVLYSLIFTLVCLWCMEKIAERTVRRRMENG